MFHINYFKIKLFDNDFSFHLIRDNETAWMDKTDFLLNVILVKNCKDDRVLTV